MAAISTRTTVEELRKQLDLVEAQLGKFVQLTSQLSASIEKNSFDDASLKKISEVLLKKLEPLQNLEDAAVEISSESEPDGLREKITGVKHSYESAALNVVKKILETYPLITLPENRITEEARQLREQEIEAACLSRLSSPSPSSSSSSGSSEPLAAEESLESLKSELEKFKQIATANYETDEAWHQALNDSIRPQYERMITIVKSANAISKALEGGGRTTVRARTRASWKDGPSLSFIANAEVERSYRTLVSTFFKNHYTQLLERGVPLPDFGPEEGSKVLKTHLSLFSIAAQIKRECEADQT